MNNKIIVKEFDSITDNPTYKGVDGFWCISKEEFSELSDFISEYACSTDDQNILDLMQKTVKKNVGNVVTFKNYVGMIELKSGLQIEILPKIAYKDTATDIGSVKTKQIFLNMLKAMKDFDGRSFNLANLNIASMSIYEIFVNMYLQEVNKLVKNGLKSNYINYEDNLCSVKGKILIKENIKSNFINKTKIFCSFDEYKVDRVENRLIKSTLLKFTKMKLSSKNNKMASRLLYYFDDVSESHNYIGDFSNVLIDRNTKNYDLLMRWSKVFLLDKSFTSFSGKTTSRVLLFKMDSLFEQFVAKLVKKFSSEKGYIAISQEKELYLFDSPSKFSLKPDIVVNKSTSLVIMDTKWKKLINDASHNYGISQADMYQMYAYAKKYEQKNLNATPDVYVLYPLNDDMRAYADSSKNQIVFSSNDGVNVRIFFIDLENYNQSISSLISFI